ncbi:MAG: hypothetical protein AAF821_24475 [Cyanobacteria bacterium P01_D01_bin.156]
MTSSLPYSHTLHVSPYGKSIPYAENSHANHGFKNLKHYPELIDDIPELSTDSSLRSLVVSLNTCNSSFFSIGCFSGIRETLHGARHRGYVEFAWNCRNCVRDAIHYFSLYFHFDQFLRTHGFNHRVKLDWLIEEAQFCDIDLCGFCCAIFIDTAPCELTADAINAWQISLQTIDSFLAAIPQSSSNAIYGNTENTLNGVTA